MAETDFRPITVAGRIYEKVDRPPEWIIDELRSAYSGFILDRLGKRGAMDPCIQPLAPGMRVCGPAVTCHGADLTVRRAAIDLAQPGDVLVIAAASSNRACFGDGTARRMMLKGLEGIVLDAPTRDAAALRTLPFATFGRGATPRNNHYPVESGQGAVNVPVMAGGVLVKPGDVIFGDDDGIVVVPRSACEQVARGLQEAVQREHADRLRMTAYVPFDVRAQLVKDGYVFVPDICPEDER
jgi:4-hydroxy-4-methyl-2-oxoglutarate aldolase